MNNRLVPFTQPHKVKRGDGMKLEQLKESDFIRELIANALIRAEKEGKYQPQKETA